MKLGEFRAAARAFAARMVGKWRNRQPIRFDIRDAARQTYQAARTFTQHATTRMFRGRDTDENNDIPPERGIATLARQLVDAAHLADQVATMRGTYANMQHLNINAARLTRIPAFREVERQANRAAAAYRDNPAAPMDETLKQGLIQAVEKLEIVMNDPRAGKIRAPLRYLDAHGAQVETALQAAFSEARVERAMEGLNRAMREEVRFRAQSGRYSYGSSYQPA